MAFQRGSPPDRPLQESQPQSYPVGHPVHPSGEPRADRRQQQYAREEQQQPQPARQRSQSARSLPYEDYPLYSAHYHDQQEAPPARGPSSFSSTPYARYPVPPPLTLPSRPTGSTPASCGLPAPLSAPIAYTSHQTSYPFPSSYPSPTYSSTSTSQSPYPNSLARQFSEQSSAGSLSPPEPGRAYYDPRNTPSSSSTSSYDHATTRQFERPQGFHDRLPSWDRTLPSPIAGQGFSAPPLSHWHRGDGSEERLSPGEYYGRPTWGHQPSEYAHERSVSPQEGSPQNSDHGSADTDRPDTTTLSHLLSHAEYSPYIRWNAEGTAFVFAHTSTDLLEIFSRFFRHSNFHSFVRQLNLTLAPLSLQIYGFTRLTTLDMLAAIESAPHPTPGLSAGDFSAFSHPLFFRSSPQRPCHLGRLKPKASKKKKSTQDANTRYQSAAAAEGLITRRPGPY
ncbi:hypothetical protein MNV49_007827 [Pseudohyphozyma bogoriensis]|nr:hypothetical protein MNV49_007827 [Pseudohyphozyma bogoriensis]